MIGYVLITPLFSFIGMGYAIYQGHSFFGVLLAYLAFSVVGALGVGGLIYQRAMADERKDNAASTIPAE